MSTRDAIEAYRDLLTGDLAAESQAQLDDQQTKRGLRFGERPVCTVLRPRFFTPSEYGVLKSRVALLLQAFDKALAAALASTDFRKKFALTDTEEILVGQDPGFNPSPTGRLDAFWVTEEDALRFNEYNAETPAGPGYTEALAEIFMGLPITREFSRKFEMRPLFARANVLHALVGSYQKWSGRRDTPRIAIVDWRDVPTASEFVLMRDYFVSQGVSTIIADPEELELEGGRLVRGDFKIDLIYKRVLISELLDRSGLSHPVVRAVREGRVCMVNPFRCKILHKKASFAVLSDEENAHLLDADERRAIDAHVPWTRLLSERRTMIRGKSIDLLPYAAEHREELVLKPNDEYGGKGIRLGWLTPAAEWEAALRQALEEPHVVQERVRIPEEPYPSFVDGRVEWTRRMQDTAPFVYYGEYMDGALTRISTAALLNVTAGGGSTVPTFVVEKR